MNISTIKEEIFLLLSSFNKSLDLDLDCGHIQSVKDPQAFKINSEFDCARCLGAKVRIIDPMTHPLKRAIVECCSLSREILGEYQRIDKYSSIKERLTPFVNGKTPHDVRDVFLRVIKKIDQVLAYKEAPAPLPPTVSVNEIPDLSIFPANSESGLINLQFKRKEQNQMELKLIFTHEKGILAGSLEECGLIVIKELNSPYIFTDIDQIKTICSVIESLPILSDVQTSKINDFLNPAPRIQRSRSVMESRMQDEKYSLVIILGTDQNVRTRKLLLASKTKNVVFKTIYISHSPQKFSLEIECGHKSPLWKCIDEVDEFTINEQGAFCLDSIKKLPTVWAMIKDAAIKEAVGFSIEMQDEIERNFKKMCDIPSIQRILGGSKTSYGTFNNPIRWQEPPRRTVRQVHADEDPEMQAAIAASLSSS